MITGSIASPFIITTEYTFPACFMLQPFVAPFRNMFARPACENALQSNVKSFITDTTRLSSSCLPFTELQEEVWKVWHFLFLPSPCWLLLSSTFSSHHSPFCSNSCAVSLTSAALLLAHWGPFHWQLFLLSGECSYHSLGLSPAHLHFLSPPIFPNILMVFYHLKNSCIHSLPLIIFQLSYCSFNFSVTVVCVFSSASNPSDHPLTSLLSPLPRAPTAISVILKIYPLRGILANSKQQTKKLFHLIYITLPSTTEN